jgi:hypothetical protein
MNFGVMEGKTGEYHKVKRKFGHDVGGREHVYSTGAYLSVRWDDRPLRKESSTLERV